MAIEFNPETESDDITLCLAQTVDQAIAPLNKAIEWDFQLVSLLKNDHWFTALQVDPRFTAIIFKAIIFKAIIETQSDNST